MRYGSIERTQMIHRRKPLHLAAALALAAFCLAPVAQAARLALVVGNDNYQNVTKLRNARNDANALAREFERAGFGVTRVLDATRDVLNESIDGFLRRVEKGDEVVFFFSGHGSQPPATGPFLLPVDIKVTSDRAIVRDGLSLEQLVDDLNKRARFSLIIIDACRDDPFRETTAGRSLPPGSALGRIEPPKGSMIIMAASKGQQALDRLSNDDAVPNGLFTRELMKQIRTPGLSASDMLKKVRASVEGAAAGVNHAQRPSLVDESSTDFFFFPGAQAVAMAAPAPAPITAPPLLAPAPRPAQAAAPMVAIAAPTAAPSPAPSPTSALARPAVSDPQREFDAWEAAGRGGTRASFEAFVAQYPDGRYTPQARIRLAGLQAASAAPAVVAQAKPVAANNPQLEFETWDRAATSKKRDDYEQYLAAYPSGRYVELARAALKKLP